MSDFAPNFDLDMAEPPDFPETDYESLDAPDDDFEAYDSVADEPPDHFDPVGWSTEQAGFVFEVDDDHSETLPGEYDDYPDVELEASDRFALHASNPVYQERNYWLDQTADPEARLASISGCAARTD